jgi:hypothetical protein
MNLLHLGSTLDLLSVLSRSGERRQQDSQQQGDDRHDNEQLDKCECVTM